MKRLLTSIPFKGIMSIEVNNLLIIDDKCDASIQLDISHCTYSDKSQEKILELHPSTKTTTRGSG